jgi:Fe-S-cluster containining protein
MMAPQAGPDGIADRDRVFLRVLDAGLHAGAERAGARLSCRRGCTECCRGPFPVNLLDAARLRAGRAELAGVDPARAAALRARAEKSVADMAGCFPGDTRTGRLADDDSAQDAFFARFASRPCPALDPETGGCDLYAWRPVSCRTYGLPVRLGLEDLPPCRLCFAGSTAAEVESCRVEPDPHGEEDAILTALERREGADGGTIVALRWPGVCPSNGRAVLGRTPNGY